MHYNKQEREIVEGIESGVAQSVPFDNDAIKKMADETLHHLDAKKQISINLKLSDLEVVKAKARTIGISYQNIIQTLVHNYANNKLELRL
jgi:predicted DNA binding CopG/RHH family protein